VTQIKPRLTPARLAWLLEVREKQGLAQRHGTVVGYQCWQLGWTEWSYRHRVTREVQGSSVILKQYRLNGVIVGEILTPEGHRILNDAHPAT